jgi:hypothetical protein
VKGHLPKRGAGRVKDVFAKAEAGLPRVLVIHHNLMRGEMSKRMGLARWRRAQRRIIEAGTDVVLCGHDHQESAEQLEGKVTVSTAGTLSTRARGGQPVSFNFVTIDPAVIQNMGVQTAAVSKGALQKTVRTVGTLEVPETGLYDMTLKINGYIDKLYADKTGIHVHKGDALFDLYSPDLTVAEEELIAARKSVDAMSSASPVCVVAWTMQPSASDSTSARFRCARSPCAAGFRMTRVLLISVRLRFHLFFKHGLGNVFGCKNSAVSPWF